MLKSDSETSMNSQVSLNQNNTELLLNVISQDKSNERKQTNCCCCCFGISDEECARWCFFNSNPAQINYSTEGYKTYSECLDCCSWCFEFKFKVNYCCKERTICFLGCCSCIFD